MSPDVCIELESAILQDENGKRYKMPNISESNHAIYFDDCDDFSNKKFDKVVFPLRNTFKQGVTFAFFGTSEQKIAYKLNLYKKLKIVYK